MEPFRLHIYACDQKKAEGAPSCSANGSAQTMEALRREIAKQGLAADVQVTTCGSLGLCTRGPNMVVYPEGVWYSGVHPGDVEEIVREHLAGGRVVSRLLSGEGPAVREEIDGNRKRMLASLKARDEAGMLPDDLQQTVNGFRESRTVLTAIELDVFSSVAAGATADSVAHKLGTSPRATESLLNALVAIGLLEKEKDVFIDGPVARRYLVAGAEHDARAAIMHTVHLWPRWSTLTECVRKGTAVTRGRQDERPDEWTEAFIAAMHRNAAVRAPQVVQAVGLDGVRSVLDLGGGSGAYSIAFAQAGDGVTAEVLDLASVVPITQRHIDEAGLTGRVTTRVGDLHDETYGSGYDLVFISAICHMNSPDENRAMLATAYSALAPAGRVVIQDFILDADKTGPKTGALFALNMLVGTRAGSSYSEEEYGSWLSEAGFRDVRRIRLPGPTALVIAGRP
ncbi:MAG: methyltransferase domain-containing protein [Gemmatimonadetes bacterium]|nr:methyltransferase domain-containing protein [Gemmatimonadota bacterium]